MDLNLHIEISCNFKQRDWSICEFKTWLFLSFACSLGMFAVPIFVLLIRSVLSCEEQRCNGTSSLPRMRLLKHSFLVKEAESMVGCINICDKQTQCRSINFNWVNFLCELNKADVHIAPQNLISAKGYVYLDNPWPKIQLVSCGKVVLWNVLENNIFIKLTIGALRAKINTFLKRNFWCSRSYSDGWFLRIFSKIIEMYNFCWRT